MFFRMVYKSGPNFLPFCHKSRVWRTDRRTEFSSQNAEWVKKFFTSKLT